MCQEKQHSGVIENWEAKISELRFQLSRIQEKHRGGLQKTTKIMKNLKETLMLKYWVLCIMLLHDTLQRHTGKETEEKCGQTQQQDQTYIQNGC